MKQRVVLTVNGEDHELLIDQNRTLIDVLRQEVKLTGAKEACGIGACGACTVLIDGKPVNSCITLAAAAEGHAIETIEGMAQGAELHSLQKAFIENNAFQCGFCTPGMILASKSLLERNPNPSEEEVNEALAGNLCRCTGYNTITKAVIDAASRMNEEGKQGDE